MDMYKVCSMVENELEKISEKGLTTANIEVAYKLIDMYKDLKTVESMEGSGYSGNDSYGRHWVRGHYSRDNGSNYGDSYRGYSMTNADYNKDESYNSYLDSKRRYRSNKTMDCKDRMMDALDQYMAAFTKKMEELAEEADCAEEKQTIERYINKIKSVR